MERPAVQEAEMAHASWVRPLLRDLIDGNIGPET